MIDLGKIRKYQTTTTIISTQHHKKEILPAQKEFTITMRISCILLIGLIQLAQTPVEDLLAAARKEEKDEEEEEAEEGDEEEEEDEGGSQDIENTSNVS